MNFKFFQLLICDYKSLRSLLILKEESSKKLKTQFYLLTAEIDRKYSTKIEKFVGRSIDYGDDIDALIDEYLFLHYNEPYKLIKDDTYLQFLKKGRELQTIGSRILNVIISFTKFEKTFTFDRVIEEIDERNIELIYGGLHTLIKRQIIVPEHYKDDDSHPLIGGFK